MDNLHTEIINNMTKDSAPVLIVNIDNRDQLHQLHSFFTADRLNNYVLLGLYGFDWNRDLSPWPAEPVFKNAEAFKGEADAYLKIITEKIIPSLNIPADYYGLAGYSLAGLFAVYAATISDYFKKIASASGSFWYPGFIEYLKENRISDNVDCLYLSLGDKEALSKNTLMAKVEDNTKIIYDSYKDNIKCTFELNEGNHFKDAQYRLYKGLKYILNN